MDNNHSQTLQAGSSEKLLPSAPASTSPFPPDVKATTGLTEVQVNRKKEIALRFLPPGWRLHMLFHCLDKEWSLETRWKLGLVLFKVKFGWPLVLIGPK